MAAGPVAKDGKEVGATDESDVLSCLPSCLHPLGGKTVLERVDLTLSATSTRLQGISGWALFPTYLVCPCHGRGMWPSFLTRMGTLFR